MFLACAADIIISGWRECVLWYLLSGMSLVGLIRTFFLSLNRHPVFLFSDLQYSLYIVQ